MNDLIEKVIKGLECCTAELPLDDRVHKSDFCEKCPYGNHETILCFGADLKRDALELLKSQQAEIERLKEQKSVEPKTGHWICGKYDDIFMCSSCEKYSMDDYPYCHWCGAKMKQEGR